MQRLLAGYRGGRQVSIHSHLYKTKRWQRFRAAHLASDPLCVMCTKAGRLEAATVVDHITPHRGDLDVFWQHGNYQSLCSYHHSKIKQREEWLELQANRVNLDGYPVDGSW